MSAILIDIERGGVAAMRRYASEFDGWDPDQFEVRRAEIDAAANRRSRELERTWRPRHQVEAFARAQRATMTDLEVEDAPGVVAGHRLVPVWRVGAYLPAAASR